MLDGWGIRRVEVSRRERRPGSESAQLRRRASDEDEDEDEGDLSRHLLGRLFPPEHYDRAVVGVQQV